MTIALNTEADIATFVNTIWEDALLVARDQNVPFQVQNISIDLILLSLSIFPLFPMQAFLFFSFPVFLSWGVSRFTRSRSVFLLFSPFGI